MVTSLHCQVFFEKEFNIDGHVYPHVEKYFQEQQCKARNNNRLAKAVLEASTAVDCKRLVRGQKFDQGEWRRKGEAEKLMYNAVYAKFSQNVITLLENVYTCFGNLFDVQNIVF